MVVVVGSCGDGGFGGVSTSLGTNAGSAHRESVEGSSSRTPDGIIAGSAHSSDASLLSKMLLSWELLLMDAWVAGANL